MMIKSKYFVVLMILCVGLLGFSLNASASWYYFTNGADWDQGVYGSTNAAPNPPGTAIKLNPNILTQYDYIWVALSGRDGVAKIDTNYSADTYVTLAESAAGGGPVKGEYLTRPNGMSGNPSRTTVDLNGDVYVTNRNEASGGKGSAVKISATPTGTTSTGVWNGSTFNRLAWANEGGVDNNGGASTASDSAISNYIRTTAPNARAVAVNKDNNVWIGGYTNREHQLYNGTTGTPIAGARFNSGHGGYGALVDGNGVVWSADWPDGSNNVVRYDPATGNATNIPVGRYTYGLGLDNSGNVWVANWTYNTVQKISSAGVVLGTYATGTSANRGVAVTPDNNIWVAGSNSNKVARLDNNGNIITTINVGDTPTGVAVDSKGKVWVTNYGSDTVMRINPATNAVDLTIELGSSADPYNYSDMTGSVVGGITNPTGTWRYVTNSGVSGEEWDKIFWNTEEEGSIPVGTSITINARAADSLAALAGMAYTSFNSGDSLGLEGQYLEVQAVLTRTGSGIDAPTPLLSDLRFSTVSHGVPEPSTMLLLGTGLLGLLAYRRKKN